MLLQEKFCTERTMIKSRQVDDNCNVNVNNVSNSINNSTESTVIVDSPSQVLSLIDFNFFFSR